MKHLSLFLLLLLSLVTHQATKAQSEKSRTFYCEELKAIFNYEKTKKFAFEKTFFKNATIEFNETSKLITITGTDMNGNKNQTIHYHFVEYFINPLTNKPNGEMIMMDNYNNKYFVTLDTSDETPIIAVHPNPIIINNGLVYYIIGKLKYVKSW